MFVFPTEIYHYIVSKLDGFERENMRLVCKMFNEFKFIITSKNPARDREVLLIDCNKRFYELFDYGHLDIIKRCYKRYGDLYWILQYSCKRGFTEFARYLHDNYRHQGARISLAWSCGNLSTMKMALECGANDFMEAMKGVCNEGKMELFEYLLSVSKLKPFVDDFISEACSGGNVNMVKRIMEFPVRNNEIVWDIGLYNACTAGSIEIIRLMIRAGSRNWNSGFRGACSGGHLEIAELMIEFGATNSDNIVPACMSGHIHIVKKLMKMREINYRCRRDGFNAAVSFGHIEIVKLLIEDSFIDNDSIEITKFTTIEIIDYLMKRGFRMDDENIHSAMMGEDLDHVKSLVKCGVVITPRIIEKIENYIDERILKYLKSL